MDTAGSDRGEGMAADLGGSEGEEDISGGTGSVAVRLGSGRSPYRIGLLRFTERITGTESRWGAGLEALAWLGTKAELETVS